MLTTVHPKPCRQCGKEFQPVRSMQVLCSGRCAIRQATAASKAKKAAERATTKARRDAIKSRAKWLAECQAIVNKLVRLRDLRLGRGCITCGAKPAQKIGGTYDAGHFLSVGSAPHLRFWMPQIALQCVVCNRHQGGRALAFRKALIERRGVEWVEQLESRHELAKFSVDYLKRFKLVMGRRLRRIEKHMEATQ